LPHARLPPQPRAARAAAPSRQPPPPARQRGACSRRHSMEYASMARAAWHKEQARCCSRQTPHAAPPRRSSRAESTAALQLLHRQQPGTATALIQPQIEGRRGTSDRPGRRGVRRAPERDPARSYFACPPPPRRHADSPIENNRRNVHASCHGTRLFTRQRAREAVDSVTYACLCFFRRAAQEPSAARESPARATNASFSKHPAQKTAS